jgi:hypothetical protein
MLLATIWWHSGRMLRGYLISYGAAVVGAGVVAAVVRLALRVGYREWAMARPPELQPPFAPQFGPVVFRLVMLTLAAATLIGSGLTRRNLFLAVGNPRIGSGAALLVSSHSAVSCGRNALDCHDHQYGRVPGHGDRY